MTLPTTIYNSNFALQTWKKTFFLELNKLITFNDMLGAVGSLQVSCN